MEVNSKAYSNKERKKVLESSFGQMAHAMTENGWTIKSAERDATPGQMAESTMANGLITICTEKDASPGRMAASTKANTPMIR